MEQLELCYLSAQKAIELFRSKKLSPVDLMQAMITRAEEVEPHINAFSYTHFEDALKSARAAEDAYMRGTARPLEGIPFAVKDESDIEGWPMSNGSLLLKENVSEMTTITVERAMNAGAIVHARTTTPEFSAAVFTWSKLWGITRNPWNLAITPGGSTGGGAAALAAGTTTIINGTDIGGSIRVPASMCGVVGYKPPFGRNPEDPPWNIETYTHSGPLARNIGDTILLQNIMSGPHPNDIVSLKPKITLPDSYETIKGKRIGFSYDLGFQPLHPDIRNLLNQALDRFRAAGAIVEEVEVGWSMEMNQATLNHLSYGMVGISIAQAHAAGGDLLTSYALKMAEYSRAVTAEDYVAAAELAASMYRRLSSIFESYDLLVCPTVALPSVPADHDYSQDTLTIDGQPVDSKFGWVMTYPFNMLSRCPVLNVPIGRASNNVPIGMQLIGPTYEDAVVFQFGAAYEAQCQTEPQTNPFINPNNRPVIG